MHLRPGAREWFAEWLAREHPELVPSYRQIYARGSNADIRYRRWLGRRVGPLLRRHGLAPKEARQARIEPTWPEGSLVSIPEQASPVQPEQLELL